MHEKSAGQPPEAAAAAAGEAAAVDAAAATVERDGEKPLFRATARLFAYKSDARREIKEV